jgi:hypothetical protein
MRRPIVFDEYEVVAILNSPEALTALIDYHETQSTYADAIGESELDEFIERHDKRREELEALRTRAETERAARCA